MANQITLSPSRVKKWVRCRKSYYWKYYRNLTKIAKEAPPTIGIVVGDTLARYYFLQPEERSQKALMDCRDKALSYNYPEFLLPGATQEGKKKVDRDAIDTWNKVVNVSYKVLDGYHDWAIERDDFEIICVETSAQIELAPGIFLMAIPDAVVSQPDATLIFEHKVRHKYRTGDFGIDYQSAACCLISEAFGTLYNVFEYGKMKRHRDLIIRSDYELNYFRNIYTQIGHEILNTPPEDLYPLPFKRCHCEYWELCNAEMQGLDIDDIIKELYKPAKEIKPVEKEEEEGNDG